jgi:hypothetical protein
MRTVPFDFNSSTRDGEFPLAQRGTVRWIASQENPLQVGEVVWLSDGEVRCQAQIFRWEDGMWGVTSDWKWEAAPDSEP